MSKKIVFATDVRFWQRRTGAHQRIFALVKYLAESGFSVTTCFTSELDTDDRNAIANTGQAVNSLVDDWKPDGIWQAAIWQAKCISNAVFPAAAKRDTSSASTRTLKEFQCPQTESRFHDFIRRASPDIIIVEYVHLAYLVRSLPGPNRPLLAIDTHDVLSRRCQSFRERGFDHWISISAKEEADAIQRFDVIVAIQPQEAAVFRDFAAHHSNVVVAGHPADANAVRPGEMSTDLRLGFLGSNNPANVDAIQRWIQDVWTPLPEPNRPRLLIGGSVCEALKSEATPERLELLGVVNSPREFYQSIDAIINPVQFGTGLKIKTIEALGFGQILLTSSHGVEGMPDPVGDAPWLVCNEPGQWQQAIQEFSRNQMRWPEHRRQVESYVKAHLEPAQVYRELLAALD